MTLAGTSAALTWAWMGHNEIRMAVAHPRIRGAGGVGLCRLRPAHDTFKQDRQEMFSLWL